MKSTILSMSYYFGKFPSAFGNIILKAQRNQFNTPAAKMTDSNIKKHCMLFLIFLFQMGAIFSQTLTFDNFEGNKSLYYSERSGVLDTVAKNPASNNVNSSQKCALYVRNGSKKFDNVKMKLPAMLSDVSPYATYLGIPPKLKMKIYTNAPVGTLVEILLGSKRGNNDYPAGTNSQYQAYTTVTGAWEELKFQFSQIPQGSETSTTEIDQITLLFNPNSSNSDTYYFDDITGPTLSTEKSGQEVIPTEITKKVESTKKVENSKKINTIKKITKK